MAKEPAGQENTPAPADASAATASHPVTSGPVEPPASPVAPTPADTQAAGFPAGELARAAGELPASSAASDSATSSEVSGDPANDPYHHDHPDHQDFHAHDHDHLHGGQYDYGQEYQPGPAPLPPAEPLSGFKKALGSISNAFQTEGEGDVGGPVKPFLDHLEDFRWTLIKLVVTVLVAMLICLIAADKIVTVLMYPLQRAERMMARPDLTHVPVMLGTNVVGRVTLSDFLPPGTDTNSAWAKSPNKILRLVPFAVGTNEVLALAHSERPASEKAATLFVVLKNYGPFESIMVCLQLALWGGLVLAMPFVLYFTGQFVLPALRVREKKFIFQAGLIGGGLFFVGVAFCYFAVLQVALAASVEFSKWLGFGADEWRAGEYLEFVIKFLLVMGLSFELPVVLLALVKIGVLDYDKLTRFRAYFIVAIHVGVAVLTPSGDPFTMFLISIPLCVLYEICVQIARYWEWRDRKREREAARAEGKPGAGQ